MDLRNTTCLYYGFDLLTCSFLPLPYFDEAVVPVFSREALCTDLSLGQLTYSFSLITTNLEDSNFREIFENSPSGSLGLKPPLSIFSVANRQCGYRKQFGWRLCFFTFSISPPYTEWKKSANDVPNSGGRFSLRVVFADPFV